ncbi:molybdopterin-dependent oxidoreductase, partial [Pseudomonas sp. 5B4]|nr:molybdopterin-dependent oxidoreductase [Pseudomonas sp. 5B4]
MCIRDRSLATLAPPRPRSIARLAADKTKGRSMIIVGAAMNHWYHMDLSLIHIADCGVRVKKKKRGGGGGGG